MEKLRSDAVQDIRDSTSRLPWPFRPSMGGMGLRRFRGLFSQSASAISDQGFFALGNFAISTILARQMSQATFGEFSSAFAAFILLSTVYCAFVVDPMLVFGASKANDRQRSYIRRVVSLHWRTALALSVSLLGIGLIRWLTGAGRGSFLAYLGWAIAAPAVLRLWLARRTAYLVVKPQYAALAGGVYLIIIAALLFAFGSYLATNVIAACLIIAAASVSVGFWLHRSLPLMDAIPDSVSSDQILGQHWTFGRWASVAGILGLLPDYIYFFVLSPERCGEYRALLNVVLPLIQVYNALGVLMMSYFARNRGHADFTRIVLRTAAAFCGTAIVLAVIALGFGGKLFNHLYAGKYDLRFTLLLPLAIVSVLFALKTVSDAVLRSLENVTTMAGVAVVGAVAALVCGVPLALRFGILGAVYGDLMVYCIATSAIAAVWLRRFKLTRLRSDSTGMRPDVGSVQCSELAVVETRLESFTKS
jgi:O-antigen/teichoic acid export membrane protein